MSAVEQLRRLAARDRGIAVVATTRADGSVQATVVNAGLLDHPVDRTEVVGFVSRGGARRLDYLRARPRLAITFRRGHDWVTVEGPVDLVGPDDPLDGVDAAFVPQLLREIFIAAGGTHDDWAEFDRVMAAERRTAVLVRMDRVYTNPAPREG